MLHSNDVVRQTAAKIDADKWNAACVCVCVCGKRRHKQGYCTTYFGQICDRMCMCVCGCMFQDVALTGVKTLIRRYLYNVARIYLCQNTNNGDNSTTTIQQINTSTQPQQ